MSKTSKSPKVAIIGSGFSGMTAAAILAQQGMLVDVYEKNDQPGGRCGIWEKDGFSFDMGPSWYWMPDVFEKFFERMGTHSKEMLSLERLDPSYQIFFTDDQWVIPADYNSFVKLISNFEDDAANQLDKFLASAHEKYKVGVQDLVYKPSMRWSEYITASTIKGAMRLNLFGSFKKHVQKYFKHPYVQQLMEFPVLFLGAKPEDTPALYSLMNYADIKLGTWYPMGGMHELAKAFYKIGTQHSVKYHFNTAVEKIITEGNKAVGIRIAGETIHYDIVISAADYEHTEQKLLDMEHRNYPKKFWDKQQMSPSCLLYFIGSKKKIPGLLHHNLFFDADFGLHAEQIYDQARFPSDPLFYVCAPSVTDPSVAPSDHENLFVLIPVAPDLEDDKEKQAYYFNLVLDRMEKKLDTDIKSSIIIKRSFGVQDFKTYYHAFKGNAYGLANTLRQTGPLRPKIINKKLNNLYYCGQLSIPGPGMPPAVISGTVVADYIIRNA